MQQQRVGSKERDGVGGASTSVVMKTEKPEDVTTREGRWDITTSTASRSPYRPEETASPSFRAFSRPSSSPLEFPSTRLFSLASQQPMQCRGQSIFFPPSMSLSSDLGGATARNSKKLSHGASIG